jgi:hypothetical protein
MAHGPRGGRVRAAFTGLGLVLCVWTTAGSIGCTNPDKPAPKPATKLDANGRPIPPGLPNTSTIPGQPGSGGVGLNRTGQSMNGVNPATGMGSGTGGIQQAGGTGSIYQSTGNGAVYNPNATSGVGLPNGYQPPPGGSGYAPGPSGGVGGASPLVPPVGPPSGYSPSSYRPGAGSMPAGGGAGTSGLSPLPPSLTDPGLVPPAPPAGAGGGVSGPIAPPLQPPPAHSGGGFGTGSN